MDENNFGSGKKENIFDLTKLAPIEVGHELKKHVSIIGDEEQKKLLDGFTEVPSAKWDTINVNDFVRYLRKDGAFRKGGFFKNSWTNSHGKNKGKKSIQLSAKGSGGYTKWTVYLADIDKLWVRDKKTTSDTTPKLQSTINNQEETITYLTKAVEQLKIDMQKNNNEQKRIINLIKKLHGINAN